MHEYKKDCQCFRCKGIRNSPMMRIRKVAGGKRLGEKRATREEQNARYLDCGPANWDDKDSPSGDY